MRPTRLHVILNKSSLKQIAEIVGLLAILVGLYFVYTEIRQTSIIARSEMSASAQMRPEYITAQFSDPGFRQLYIKGLRTPSDLLESERLRLTAFFEDVLTLMYFEYHHFSLGIFEEYEVLTRFYARRYFMRGFGRAWWNIRRESVPRQISDIVEQEVSTLERSIDWIWLDDQLTREIDSL